MLRGSFVLPNKVKSGFSFSNVAIFCRFSDFVIRSDYRKSFVCNLWEIISSTLCAKVDFMTMNEMSQRLLYFNFNEMFFLSRKRKTPGVQLKAILVIEKFCRGFFSTIFASCSSDAHGACFAAAKKDTRWKFKKIT